MILACGYGFLKGHWFKRIYFKSNRGAFKIGNLDKHKKNSKVYFDANHYNCLV